MNVKKTMFIEYLLLGDTVTEAAKKAGVSEATAYRWLKQGLREIVESRRKDIFEANLNRLENSMTKAIDALNELIANKDTAPQRLGAARAVVENVIRVFELRNVEARMDAIEKAYSGNLGEN
jgi:phage terminase small subunit